MKRVILMTIVAVLSFAGAANMQAQPGKHSAEHKEKFFMAKMKMIQQELSSPRSKPTSSHPSIANTTRRCLKSSKIIVSPKIN